MRPPNFFVLAGVMLLSLGSAASADVTISIDKTAQLMDVSVDGAPLYSWPVSTGRRGYTTPSGSYKPFRMEPDHFSEEWDNAPMPHSIFFTSAGHAIHGSYDINRLGSPASHGCVRLSPENAATLYALVSAEGLANTRVVVRSGAVMASKTRPAEQPASILGDAMRTARDTVTGTTQAAFAALEPWQESSTEALLAEPASYRPDWRERVMQR